MLSANQINSLYENKEYDKTRKCRYNWKYSKTVCTSKDFSISTDIWVNGVSYKHLGILKKIVIWFIKRIIISKEIGEYRNDVVKRVLDSSISVDFDICSLITSDYMWVADSVHKLKQIKAFVLTFISDSKIQIMIYDVLGYSELETEKRKCFMDAILYKINTLFYKRIILTLKGHSISSRHEYSKFIEINQEELIQKQELNQKTGNLVTVVRNENKEGEHVKY